ncbi:MAG TPA: SurA N-terminal domain-containing protein [Limnochordales bacterium]|nr:SurA N-terminal domain-containing protein [Limnochordales bacterium]
MFFTTLRKHMRWIIIVVVVAFVAGSVYVGVNFGQQATEAAAPVAEVNGRAISYAEFQQVYLNNLQMYSQFFGPIRGTLAEELRYISLNSLIDNYLTLEAARAANLPVEQQEIDAALADIKASFPDDAAYRRALSQAGLTEARLRDLIREDVMVRKLREQVRHAEFTDDQVREAMVEVRTRHILIEPDDGLEGEAAWDAALAQAQALREELLNGASFEELAAAYSADGGSASQGGDVGWVSQSTPFVEPFKDAALALAPGEISEPVRTVYGYHLIQVTERREPSDDEFAQRRDEVLAQLQQAAGDRQWAQWLEERRSQAQVVIHDWQLRAHHAARNGQLEAAVGYYQEALAEDPFNPYLHVSLAGVYEQLDRMEDAVAQYEQAVAKADSDPELHVQLALAYRAVGRDEDAAASLRRAGELNPWDAQLQLTLMQLFAQMGLEEDVAVASQRLAEIQAQFLAQLEAQEEEAEAEAGDEPDVGQGESDAGGAGDAGAEDGE